MAKEKLVHYLGFYVNGPQKHALDKLCRAKQPDGRGCLSQVLRDCIDWAYKPLMAKYFETPLSETQTEEPKNGNES